MTKIEIEKTTNNSTTNCNEICALDWQRKGESHRLKYTRKGRLIGDRPTITKVIKKKGGGGGRKFWKDTRAQEEKTYKIKQEVTQQNPKT